MIGYELRDINCKTAPSSVCKNAAFFPGGSPDRAALRPSRGDLCDLQLDPPFFSPKHLPWRRCRLSQELPEEAVYYSFLRNLRRLVTFRGHRIHKLRNVSPTSLLLRQVLSLLHIRKWCLAAHTPVQSHLSSRSPSGEGMGGARRRGRAYPLPGLCPHKAGCSWRAGLSSVTVFFCCTSGRVNFC